MASKRSRKRSGTKDAVRVVHTRRPFVLQVHGDGVDIDVRVEAGSPIERVVDGVVAGMMNSPAFAHGFSRGAWTAGADAGYASPISPDLQEIVTRSTAGSAVDLRDLDDAHLERAAVLISDEQRRRVEARS